MNRFFLLSAVQTPGFLAVLCVYFLRVTVAYGAAWLLSKLSKAATVRFMIWLLFLFASAAYWIYCIGSFAWKACHPALIATSGKGLHNIELSTGSITWLSVMLTLSATGYGVIVISSALMGIVARLRLRAALRKRIAPPEQILSDFDGVAQVIGAPPCQVWLMPGLPSPASFGWLKPAVYLPAGDSLLDDRKLHDVFWHELTHVCRRDALWDSLTRVARTILCFHPVVHRAAAALRLERELACDLNVVRQNPAQRHQYADTLVHFGWRASLAAESDHLEVALTAQATMLSKRIRLILDGEQRTSIWSKTARSLLSSAAVWSFMTVVPVLWVTFNLPMAGSAAKAALEQIHHPAVQVKVHRWTPIGHPGNGSGVTILAAKPAQLATISQAVPPHHGEAGPHYTLMPSADAPLSDPPQTNQAANGTDSHGIRGTGATLPGQQSVPSKNSVLIDAAGQLAQMGIGRDHDRD